MIVLSALLIAVSLNAPEEELSVKVIAGMFGAVLFMAALACAEKPEEKKP